MTDFVNSFDHIHNYLRQVNISSLVDHEVDLKMTGTSDVVTGTQVAQHAAPEDQVAPDEEAAPEDSVTQVSNFDHEYDVSDDETRRPAPHPSQVTIPLQPSPTVQEDVKMASTSADVEIKMESDNQEDDSTFNHIAEEAAADTQETTQSTSSQGELARDHNDVDEKALADYILAQPLSGKSLNSSILRAPPFLRSLIEQLYGDRMILIMNAFVKDLVENYQELHNQATGVVTKLPSTAMRSTPHLSTSCSSVPTIPSTPSLILR